MGIWDVTPDAEREHWALKPFVGVGPLSFGMSPDEATTALGGVRPNPYRGKSFYDMTIGWYRRLGLTLYYRAEQGLCGISVDARRGPQVVADGMPLVGRIPSEVEAWMIERAEAREPFTEVAYIAGGEPGSLTLGVLICVQRAADVLLTRPVFIPKEALDDVSHWLPPEAWAIHA
jgi:hypothetical protein